MLRADGEVVWSWRPLAGVKLATMLCIAPMTVTKKVMDTGEITKETVKTIARGMPVIRLHLWRDYARVLLSFAREAVGAG